MEVDPLRPDFSKTIREQTLLGSFHALSEPALIELVGHAGFDYVVFEFEHGLRDSETVGGLIRAADTAGLFSMVRLAATDVPLIGRMLDAGADGVLVSHVTTADQARRIVAEARYPPEGVRGEGPTRRPAIWELGPPNRRAQIDHNEQVVTLAVIEDAAGAGNVDEILAVDGLTGIMPGPGDLALGLGGLDVTSEPVVSLVSQIEQAAHRHPYKVLAGFVLGPNAVESRLEVGYQTLVYGYDINLIGKYYQDLASRTRALISERAGL